jgi:hypothetical protein
LRGYVSLNPVRARQALSIAVASDVVVAVAGRGRTARTHRVPVDLVGTGDDAAALNQAFAQLRTELGTSADSSARASADIAVLPPLADARLIALPPLRSAEAHAVLRRDSGRYFVGVQSPHIVAVHSNGPTPRARAGGPILAAAANAPFIDAIGAAASAAGWQVNSIVPAHAAWTMAAGASGAASAAHAFVAVTGDTAHIVRLSGRRAAGVRRVPLAALDDIVSAAMNPDGAQERATARVAIHAAEMVRDDLARAFSARGWSVVPARGDAASVAAQFARNAGVRFVSVAFAAGRHTVEKRVALRLLLAAAVLVVFAGAVEMWGAQREWNAIRARRAELRAEVGPLLAKRDSMDLLLRQTEEIETLAQSTPRWTPALFDLALLLPPESHLTGLYATGDTVVLEAQGAGAGTALQALRSASTLRDARLVGSVEREMDGGATSIERFRLSARLAPPPAAPSVARGEAREEP